MSNKTKGILLMLPIILLSIIALLSIFWAVADGDRIKLLVIIIVFIIVFLIGIMTLKGAELLIE